MSAFFLLKKVSKKKWFYGLYLLTVVFISLEIILRIYSPFHFRIKGEKIVLDTNKKYFFENSSIPVLEKEISWRCNSLGFRGPEMPADNINRLKIITVGGSTTVCNFLSDGFTWSDKLYQQLNKDFDVWLNNAGFIGHSTFGHFILLQDYLIKLKPDVIVFLIGCNDVEHDENLSAPEASNMVDSYATFLTFLSKKSEVINTIGNLFRSRKAYSRHLTDSYVDLKARRNDTLFLPQEVINKRLKFQEKFLPAYKNRIGQIIKVCRDNNIIPVLVTQPTLLGVGIDGLSGADLCLIKIDDDINGCLWWQRLEVYNNVTREIADEQNIKLIDLAREMPKSSLYFYDLLHFTREGAGKVSELMYSNLHLWMQLKFSGYKK